MDVRLVARVKKIVSSVTISAIIFSMVSPAFAAVSPTFVALETVPNTIPVNDQTATTTITQTQTVALPKISTVTIANVEVGDMFTATFGGGNSVTFTATTTSASDVASGMNTLIQNHALYPVAPFTSSVAGDTITFTGKVAGANFAQSSSTTNAAPTAQVVTLTPTDVVDGLTFSATVDGNTVSHNTTPGSTVATVTATLAGVLSTAAVTCVDSATHITCTADVAGTPFMYSTNVVDIGAPTVPTNLLPNGTATDNDFDFTWDASTDEVVGAITYEFQSSQNNAVDGSGVLTTGVWTSGTLPTPMIHSSGAPDGVWYWQVRAKDSAGNASAWSPVVSMTIDSVPPVITIDPYTTTPTNGDVTVTASTNEGSLNATSHTFTVNGSFTFIATDAAGNVTNSIVTLTNIDKTAPVITLNGSTPMDVSFGAAYVEPGASCTDNVDLVCSVMINGSVVTSALGTYLVTYDATDSVGNASLQVERTVNVVDIEKPIITLLGTATITVAQNSVYTDAGATASDNVDGDITASIVSGGSVNTSILGDYILTYDVTDSSLNTATQVTRTVTVADLTAPTISEITPVTPTPTNDNTPSYTFSTDEAGTIIYAGGCTSTTTIANVGNNTIELDMLADATYSTCTITVTDNSPAANTSTPLTLSTFTVDTTDPSVTINQAGTQGDPTATSILYFTAILSEAVAGATFTCDDIITTNAVCDSVTNSDINTYTVQVHTLAAWIVTVLVSGGGVMDLAGNTNTASSSTDNSVHFTLSGGGIIMPFAPLTPTDPIRMDIGDDEDMAEVSHVTEEEDGDELLDQDDGHSNTDESPLNPTSFPNNTADTTTTTTSSDNTTNNNSSNGAANNSPTSDSAPTASSGQLLVTTDTPTTENVITETPKDTEEATIDIGGGNATKKPSYALAWILLGLIALLNFAWFYTRKNNPPQNPQV